ncbi:hypothetical protein [Nitrosospira sp. NRS527]|uniref:hypothetical protein n=1 Tax=Nitrosospira sp. NRS527 TaxID=155925 RepID=UPI001BD100A8|nr:hypothetical protein [Nitrosospira sp. NRS527]
MLGAKPAYLHGFMAEYGFSRQLFKKSSSLYSLIGEVPNRRTAIHDAMWSFFPQIDHWPFILNPAVGPGEAQGKRRIRFRYCAWLINERSTAGFRAFPQATFLTI